MRIDHRAALDKPRNRYPSVTTILGKTKDMTVLNQWKATVGAVKAKKIAKASAGRGTTLHHQIERYYEDGTLGAGPWWDSIYPLLQRITNPVWMEEPLWFDHPTLKFFGIADCLAEIDGVLTLIDWKTARSPRRESWIGDYKMQAAAYAAAARQRFPELRETLKQTAIVIALANQREVEDAADEGKVVALTPKKGQLFVSRGNSIPIQWSAFQQRARTYFHTKHADYCRQVGQEVIPGYCAA